MENESHKRIVAYYDQCEVDYRYNWHLDDCLALHIGYWDHTTPSLSAALARQNEIMMDAVRIRSTDRVIDAGCGIGGSSIYLARRCGCRVAGITLSRKQADSATALARRHAVDHLADFSVMDFSRTGFADGMFDVFWALESSCYAEDKSIFAREAHRLLKPGGRLILADGFEARKTYTRPQRALLDNWTRRWAVDSLENVERFGSNLKAAGFVDIDYRDISTNVAPSSRKLLIFSLLAWPWAKLSERSGQRSKIQNENLLGAIFQYFSLRFNLARYGIYSARKRG